MNKIKFFYTSKTPINIRAKVHLNSFTCLKVIYPKSQQNVIISLHETL